MTAFHKWCVSLFNIVWRTMCSSELQTAKCATNPEVRYCLHCRQRGCKLEWEKVARKVALIKTVQRRKETSLPGNNKHWVIHHDWLNETDVDCVSNVSHAQKQDFVFQWNGRVHLNRPGWGCQFSRLLAVEVCGSAGSDCIIFSKYVDHHGLKM